MLTPKQARFVEEYLVDLNASAAARRAGYAARRADAMGHENLRKPEIAAAIAAAKAERSQRTKVDADWLLTRLAQEAEADLADLYHSDGSLKSVHEWPDVWRKGLVAGIEVLEEFAGSGQDRVQIGWVKKVKLADRVKVKELIGRHVDVGAWRERVEHTGTGGGPVQMVSMSSEEFRAIAAELVAKV